MLLSSIGTHNTQQFQRQKLQMSNGWLCFYCGQTFQMAQFIFVFNFYKMLLNKLFYCNKIDFDYDLCGRNDCLIRIDAVFMSVKFNI